MAIFTAFYGLLPWPVISRRLWRLAEGGPIDDDPEDPIDEHSMPDPQHVFVQQLDEHVRQADAYTAMAKMATAMVKPALPVARK